MGKLQELLTTTAESELIESEIYSVLIEAVRANLVGTQLLARRIGPESIPGSSIDIDLETANSLSVEEIAEGAEFTRRRAKAETFNLKPVKYGCEIGITKEMMEDSKFALAEWQISTAGYEMARRLDWLILSEINTGADANSTDHITTVTTALTAANITATMKFLEQDGYRPDYMIVSSHFAEDLRNLDTFVEADKLGSREAFENGLVGMIFGMRVIQTEQAMLEQTTYNYGFIIDSRHALVLAEKRPITIERYKRENQDMVGICVSARWVARYLRMEACAELKETA